MESVHEDFLIVRRRKLLSYYGFILSTDHISNYSNISRHLSRLVHIFINQIFVTLVTNVQTSKRKSGIESRTTQQVKNYTNAEYYRQGTRE